MKVFTNNTFTGYFPVGGAAVVVADSSQEAVDYLNEKLVSMGLEGDVKQEDMIELDTSSEDVVILLDGNY